MLEQEPAADRAERDADAGDRGPERDRAAALLGREHVGDDRQRRRHDERAADAHERAGRRSAGSAMSANAESSEPSPKTTMPNCSAPLPPEAVAEAARGEQQAREHERVRVDHPLELADRSRRGRAASVGSATLRIELSTMITSRLRHSTPRIHQRCRYERLVRSNGSRAGARACAASSWGARTLPRMRRDFPIPTRFRGATLSGDRRRRSAAIADPARGQAERDRDRGEDRRARP